MSVIIQDFVSSRVKSHTDMKNRSSKFDMSKMTWTFLGTFFTGLAVVLAIDST